MPVLREQDFDKMAAQVVDQFLGGRAKLADAAAKQAMEAGLNPDQIDRLTQSANTMTFLRMMENAKAAGASDLTHEFDPIDSRQVLRIVIDQTGVHVDPPEAMAPPEGPPGLEHELPDEMAALRGPSGMPPEMPPGPPPPELPGQGPPPLPAPGENPFAKKDTKKKDDKDDDEDDDEDEPKKKDSPKEAGFRLMRLRKLAGLLEDQYHQAEWAFEDTGHQLTQRFRRVYPTVTFASFEKDALAEHGDEVGIRVLNLVRSDLHLPTLDPKVAMEKSATLQATHVSEDTAELALFETLVKIAREANQLQRGLEHLRLRCA